MAFAITVLPAVSGHRWVRVEGPVDASTAEDVRAVMRTAIGHLPTRRLTIDLRDAHVRDEAGRRCLAEVAALADAAGVQTSTLDGRALDVAVVPPGATQPVSPAVRPEPALLAG